MEINLITQADSGGKVNILEDYSISHCEKKKRSYEHVYNSECLPDIIMNFLKKNHSEW